jgi:hypothetical protein
MRNQFAAILAILSVAAAAVTLFRVDDIDHDVARSFIKILSVVWLGTGVAQLGLVAAMNGLRMGRVLYFVVSLLLAAAPCIGILTMIAKADSVPVVTVLCVAWLIALLAYLAEFAGLTGRHRTSVK